MATEDKDRQLEALMTQVKADQVRNSESLFIQNFVIARFFQSVYISQ